MDYRDIRRLALSHQHHWVLTRNIDGSPRTHPDPMCTECSLSVDQVAAVKADLVAAGKVARAALDRFAAEGEGVSE
jgi:hypothetical protein